MTKPLIYIAGNYSFGGTATAETRRANLEHHKEAFVKTQKQGYLPFSPILQTAWFEDGSDHLPWMEYDLQMLTWCEGILCIDTLDKVKTDTGVHVELAAAFFLSMPLFIQTLPDVEDFYVETTRLAHRSFPLLLRNGLSPWPIPQPILSLFGQFGPTRASGCCETRQNHPRTGADERGRP